jgi:anti-sigma factor RsiW
MECDNLDPLIESIADGNWEPDAAARAHLASCANCAARLEHARRIESFFAYRETVQPPPSFTGAVMSGVVNQRWQTERVVDIGFNLAIAAGLAVVLASGFGAAWSLGLLTTSIDFETLAGLLGSEMTSRILSQAQTVVLGAALLTTALVLWWWAEAESA